MLEFISFLLVCIGSFNWFTIGILQYDFVAGLFGSQANVFSRLIYALVGVASIVVIFNMIKNKGKFIVSFKKADKEFKEYKEEKMEEKKLRDEKLASSLEASNDFYKEREEARKMDRETPPHGLDSDHRDNKMD